MDHSVKLRKAKSEILEILKSNDIAAVIILADGEGIGEYGFFADTPTWSDLSVNDFGFKIKMNNKTEESMARANKIVNAIVVMTDLCAINGKIGNGLLSEIKKHVEIEYTSKPTIYPDVNHHQ